MPKIVKLAGTESLKWHDVVHLHWYWSQWSFLEIKSSTFSAHKEVCSRFGENGVVKILFKKPEVSLNFFTIA